MTMPLNETEQRIEREDTLIESWTKLIQAKGITKRHKAAQAAEDIYTEVFIDNLPSGRKYYHIDAAESFTPVLASLPWQYIRLRYVNKRDAERNGNIETCPRCHSPLKRAEIMYPQEGTPFKMDAWYCNVCNLALHQDDLDAFKDGKGID